jgi:hypothetical protein
MASPSGKIPVGRRAFYWSEATMTDKEVLRRVAFYLVGMSWNDLTTAEKNIVEVLITYGYLAMNRDGEVEYA